MASVNNIDELRDRLKRMSPQQLRNVVKLGKLHAKLTKQKRKAHGLTATQAKILAKLESKQLGI